jgi:hypothetical protein
LLVYYLEERLSFTTQDVSVKFPYYGRHGITRSRSLIETIE